jgi:hypothetical protein
MWWESDENSPKIIRTLAVDEDTGKSVTIEVVNSVRLQLALNIDFN